MKKLDAGKLTINRETLRTLSADALDAAHGGGPGRRRSWTLTTTVSVLASHALIGCNGGESVWQCHIVGQAHPAPGVGRKGQPKPKR